MRRVINATSAVDDIDHIHMLVDNNPKVPSRINALILGTGESPAPCMIEMARGLEEQGADFLVIPCNTAHYYYPEVAAAVDIPVMNLIELTSKYVIDSQPGLGTVGLLASTALQLTHLYEPWLEQHDVQVLYPRKSHQNAIMEIIRSVKSNSHTEEQLLAYNCAAKNLEAQGAQCLVVACTELSVIGERLRTPLPVYDAAELLAQAIIREAVG